MVQVKGHEIGSIVVTGAGNRRAVQFKNNIITALRKVGVNESDINIPLERMAIKKAKASVTWYQSGHRMHYSHSLQSKYVENLHVILKVLEIETNLVDSEQNTLSEFNLKYKEDSDVDDKRKEARDFFGCDHDETDFGMIHKKYKEMAKELHPDMPTGDTEKFKALNVAHKILKRELT